MAGLAAATTRIKLIATVNPLLHHPASMAKMSATVQDVSGGRLGLNIITGSTLGEYTQMGVVPPDYDRVRYAYAAEWVQVLKRLWSEPRVSHTGEYFHLADCVSEPKPRPRPFLVCAGVSDDGLRFTAREADYSFLSRSGATSVKDVNQRALAIAAEEGTSLKTATPVVVVLGDSTTAAQSYWSFLQEGADVEANQTNARLYGESTRGRNKAVGAELQADPGRISSQKPILGGPRDVADEIIALALDSGLDSVCMIFPDYLDGLRRFGRDVMPLLGRALAVGPEAAKL